MSTSPAEVDVKDSAKVQQLFTNSKQNYKKIHILGLVFNILGLFIPKSCDFLLKSL